MANKTLVVGVVLLLVLSGMLVVAGGNKKLDEDLTGSNDVQYLQGAGTLDDPMVISEVRGLQEMMEKPEGHYILSNDIDASETWEWNEGAGFIPVGEDIKPFTGSLDGQNFTISGLYIHRPYSDCIGLFGYVDVGGEIRNVGVVDAVITGDNIVGGLVGYNRGTVENSYATGDVNGSEKVGGLVGYNEGTVSSSYATGDVRGHMDVGGFVGYNTGSVSNSYATGSVTRRPGSMETDIGGFVGMNYRGEVLYCYSTGGVEVEDGDALRDNGFAGGIDEGRSFNMEGNFWDMDTSGQSRTACSAEGLRTSDMMNQTIFEEARCDFTAVWWMVDGETRPFLRMEWSTQIRNGHQLQMMLMSLSAEYTLMFDIDLTDYLTDARRMWGTDLTSGSGFVPVTPFNGRFDGQNHTITGLYVHRPDMINVGFFGYIDSTCIVKNVGLEDVNVTGNGRVGGLVGHNNGVVENSYSKGVIFGNGWYIGGLVGMNNHMVTDSHSMGSVSGNTKVVGGLVGENAELGSIYNCFSSADASVVDEWAGGLAGINYGSISHSYATGDVSGNNSVGGLTGENWCWATVSNSFATGAVTGSGDSIGGLVGHNLMGGVVIHSYATGDVMGDQLVGGLVGRNWGGGTVENSYSTGTVSEGIDSGGLVGSNDGIVTNSFWDMENSGMNESGGGMGKTTEEMKTRGTFTGWDFDSQWHMVEGITYPLLQWQPLPSGDGSPGNPYIIYDVDGLQNMTNDLSAHYLLAWDIDASETSSRGEGFFPVGDDENRFTGSLDGRGYTIHDLHINRPDMINVGLFGYTEIPGTVKNVVLEDVNVTGNGRVGGLVGYNQGTVHNSYTNGTIMGNGWYVGGLIGMNTHVVTDSHSSGTVRGNTHVAGGLTGENTASGSITDCSSSAVVLVFDNWGGGLVGANYGSISSSYATGYVNGNQYVGGLAGLSQGTVENSHATGTVIGQQYVGGLLGLNEGAVSYSYGAGTVDGGYHVGGLVGSNTGTVSNSFYDNETTGQSDTGKGVPKTTAEMRVQSTFTGWDFTDTWYILEEVTYPLLIWQPLPTGDGTPGNPYIITNVHELQNMSNDVTAHYVLANDIDASETSTWNDGAGFEPVGNDTDSYWDGSKWVFPKAFSGSLDGRKHIISGLYINRSNSNNIGLFGSVGDDGEIHNIGMVDGDVSGYDFVGVLMGRNHGGTVSNSFVTGSVSGNWYVGGLVGHNWYGTVSNSFSSVSVSGVWEIGGFVGRNWESTVSNSYATGTVTRESSSSTAFGGFVGNNLRGVIINCYSTGSVHYEGADDPLDRGFAGTVNTESGYEMTGNFWDVDTSGQTSTEGNATGMTTAEMKTQGTFVDWDFDDIWLMVEDITYPFLRWQDLPSGEGTPENPYIIYDVHDLQNMKNNLSAHYILAWDIDASETTGWNGGFDPIGTNFDMFTGSFDGRGYEISSLYINRPSTNYVGLFGIVGHEGEVRDVGVVEVDVTGSDNVGGLVGSNWYGTVSNSYATGKVSGTDRLGGLVGQNRGTVSNSYATGNVSGAWYVGGFLGDNFYGTVSNTYATGTVTRKSGTTNTNLGGFVGRNYQGIIINSYSTGSVHYQGADDPTNRGFTGSVDTGGDYEMNGNYWDVETSGQTGTAGNATGKTTAEMKTQGTFVDWDFDEIWIMVEDITYPFLRWQTYPSGEGTPANPYIIYDVHDLQGINNDLAAHYILAWDIDASETIGWNGGAGFDPIGEVFGDRFTGRFDGRGYEISGLYINRPDVHGIGLFAAILPGAEIHNVGMVDVDMTGNHYVAGLLGYNWGGVYNSYAIGTVTGVFFVGGLMGVNDGTVSNSYATVTVSGTYYVGGFMGWNNEGTVENSYSKGNVSGSESPVGGFTARNDGTVENCYASGTVSGKDNVGGFVGWNNEGTVENSYATTIVTRISGSLSTTFGGFAALNERGKIINCYATGSVHYEGDDDPTDKGFAGGVFTGDDYQMTGNYWDVETSGQTGTAGNATGKTTEDMKTRSTFVGWDFDEIWHMAQSITYPLFQWQDLPETTLTESDLVAYAESDGWNFVSFDLAPVDPSLTSLLAGIEDSYDRVMWFDASQDEWLTYVPGRPEHYNTLGEWNHRMGIWIRMTGNATLTVEGYVPTDTNITLYPGWNMVGLPSESPGNHDIPAEVTRVGYFYADDEYNVAYDNDPTNFVFQPGQGYWVYNGGDELVVWTVEY